ncbi:MAG: IS21 family transposase [Planctomycetales bacterium]|nr:IS21 family transposase [Planctomycetales bacterium]
MLTVEDYAKIRRAHRDGMSIRAIARTFGHSRHKIRQVLEESEPRAYRRSRPHRPKLSEAFRDQIDAILLEDQSAPKKQRHTAKAIHRRLRASGFAGGYDQVRRYVKSQRTSQRETFIPLVHEAGQRAESDFGKIYVDFPEGRVHVSVLILTWAYSNCTFAIALPNERVESILFGTMKAFEFFGCVPKELWWDNPKTVAIEILRGRNRKLNDKYVSLASHYNFEPLFCMPARGNEKPHVENRVKYLQRNWATPVPQFANLDELNQYLYQCCVNDQQRTVSGKSESIATRFAQDRQQSLPLPTATFDPAVPHEREVDKYQSVRFDDCYYSVPRGFAFQKVKVKAYVDRVEIVGLASHDYQLIARHDRSYAAGSHVLDPLHFLETLERKPACLDHTDVFKNWKIPREITDLRASLEDRHGPQPGAKQYIRVLQLLASHPTDRVCLAVQQCQTAGVVTAQRIAFRCDELEQKARRLETRSRLLDNVDTSSSELAEPRETNLRGIPEVYVPLPNFAKFDSFLSHGGDSHAREDCREFTS